MSHTPPIPEDCWRSKRILQLERELAEVNKSCEANRKAYHSAISDCVKLQRELATVTADIEFRRDLGALQQQEYDKVTDERDAWKQSTQDERNIHMTTIEGRDAAQQEARRLREALQRAMDEYDNGGKCWHSNEVAGAMRAALASTPAPVHKDTERLKKVKSALEWIAESRSGHASTLAREALPAIDAELAKEGK